MPPKPKRKRTLTAKAMEATASQTKTSRTRQPRSVSIQAQARPNFDPPVEPYDPADEPIPIASMPSHNATSEAANTEDVLNLLMQMNQRQSDHQKAVDSKLAKLASDQKKFKHQRSQSVPAFQRKGYQVQFDLNQDLLTLIDGAIDNLHDPDEALLFLTQAKTKLSSRNAELRLADSVPGALGVLDKVREFSSLSQFGELSADPVVASVIPELIKQAAKTPPNRGVTQRLPFPAAGGAAATFFQPQLVAPMSSYQPSYIQQQQANAMWATSAQKKPRQIIGPCHACHTYGHLQRNCPMLFPQFPTPWQANQAGGQSTSQPVTSKGPVPLMSVSATQAPKFE